MSNAADGYLGDWLPHKDSCRCSDCQLEKAQQRIARLEQERNELHHQLIEITDHRVTLIKERDELKEQVAKLSAPVSDEEWATTKNWKNGIWRDNLDTLIAARAKGDHAKEEPHA